MELEQKFEEVEIGKLKMHPGNPRNGDIDLIGESININGFFGAIVAQRSTGRILAGNHRWKAAKAEGKDKVPVAWVDVDDDHALRILLADNRTNDVASYDESALASLLTELNESCGLEGTGYKPEDLDQLLADISPQPVEGNTDPDDIPEDVEPRCKKGDIWQLGSHRLMCGDSTSKKSILELMAGERAGMCFTSPPYNGSISFVNVGNSGPLYEGYDDNKPSIEYLDMVESVLDNCFDATDGFIFWNVNYNTNSRSEFLRQILSKIDFLDETICWKKTALPVPHGLTRTWEPIFVFNTNKSKRLGHANKTEFNYWDVNNTGCLDKSHRAAFPVQLVLKALELCSPKTMIEPFCGSGTSVIAGEQAGVQCFAMELLPAYCDVTIKRWEDFTGKKAVKAMNPDVTK